MSNQYQDFDDAESDTGDFNPAAAESDNEEAQDVKRAEPQSPKSEQSEAADTRRPTADNAADDEDEDKPERADDGEDVKRGDNDSDGGNPDDDEEGPGEDITNNNDDDDEDDEEDEEEDAGPTRKRRKRARNQFIDVEAEVDDEDEDVEDEDEEEREEFVADTHPDDEGLDAAAERDDRRHRELDMQRQRDVEIDAEKEAERFRKKYGRNQAAALHSAVTPQSYLVPSVHDPSLWAVKCKLGKEREVCFSLMKRIQDRLHTREALDIYSAFERASSIPGRIYVEAYGKPAVLNALNDLAGAYPRSDVFMVPLPEMPDLLRVRKTESIENGKYVRVKRGKYAGDLAQVTDVMDNGLEVELKLVPRLDYGATDDPEQNKRKRGGGTLKNPLTGRPPARLFNEMEAGKRMGKYLQQGSAFASKEFTFLGDSYINGFLMKVFKLQHIQTEDVNPTLEEVRPFQEGGEDGGAFDLQALQTARKQQKSTYLVGEKVEVWQGEQSGAAGSVMSAQGDIVSLRVTEGSLRGQTIEAPTGILRKYFQVGNHVTVVNGTYTGASGFVERIKDERVSIISDSDQKELTIFSKDLREADEAIGMPPAADSSGYELHDLVRMDNATVGVVIKTDRDQLRVLDQYGNVQNKTKSGIQQKIERKRFDTSIDRDGAEIKLDDSVKEVIGAQRQGIVMHMNRGFLFMKSRSQLQNAGMFIARNTNVVATTAQNRSNQVTNGAGRPNGAPPMPPPPRTFGRDRYLGKTCRIRKGALKGHFGIVKDATEVDVRLELQGRQKIITIKKDELVVVDPETGETINMPSYGGARPTANYAMRPAMDGASRAPAWGNDGGRTPGMNGGRTPGWGMADGGRTPAWAASGTGSKTPAWKQASRPGVSARNDGSRTAYGGGDGSRTSYGGMTSYGGASTWNPNNSTPFHPSSFGGSRTPAAGAYGSAATPGGYAADTPAAGYGYGSSYATPGAGATPGAYAQTPGASGLADDGYED